MGLTTVQFDTGIALAHSPVAPGVNCPATNGVGGKFAPMTAFYWRVHAQDSGGYSDWSNVFEFSTSYPKVTVFGAPTYSATEDTITFSWTPVGAYSYSLLGCFHASPDVCPLQVSKIIPPYLWRIPAKDKITSGQLIDWRVRADGTWGPSLWSDPQSATTP